MKTFKKASLAENAKGDRVIMIDFSYDIDTLFFVRELPGRQWHANQKCWSAPLFKETIEALIKNGFELDHDLHEVYAELRLSNSKILKGISGLKGELYPFQAEGVAFIDANKGRALIADEMGLGKAQPLTSLVLTPIGWREIGSMKKGDQLFGPDGKIHLVTGVYPQGIKEIYEVVFSDKTSCQCCLDHLWAVRTPYERWKKKPYKILPLKEIKENLYSGSNSKWSIPITDPIEFAAKDLPLEPYVLGVLIGDGNLSQHCVNFSSADQDIIDEVTRLLPKQNKITKINCIYNYREKGINTNGNFDYRITIKEKQKSNLVVQVIKKYHLNKTSAYKFIPDDYKFSSIQQRINLLRGLMDTDGYICKKNNTTQFTTVSEQLCDDVIFIIQSLGGVAYKNSKITKYTYQQKEKFGKRAYTITIKLPKGINPFFCKRKSQVFIEKTKYLPSRWIRSIEFVRKEEAVCISTSQPDKLYLTNNCIVTHNTIQAIGWLQLHSEARPAVIVVPKSLKLNWEKELNKWLEKPIINVLSGSGKDIRKVKGDIIIINYDILPVWLDRIKSRDPQVLITDECHFYKNNQAKRTKAVKRLAKGIPNVIALSGTPIQNRPIEIYNAITIIKPELFPNYIKFRERYCNPKFNGFGWTYNGASHIAELHNILVNSVMLRRLKKDVLTDLPDKTNAFVPLELDNRATYEAAKHNLIAFLRQFKGSRAAEKAMRAEALVRLGTLKQLAAKGKLHNAIDWIEEFLSVEDKLVVFAIHKEIIDALMQAFGTIAVKIDGSVSSLQREKAVEKFQNDPKIKLFVGNITAAGVGLTLTASSNVAFLELPWTPGSVTQAADRCHRIGQKDNVTIHFLLAENTIDEDMAKLIDKKQMILDNVLDGKDTSEESLISELFKIYEV